MEGSKKGTSVGSAPVALAAELALTRSAMRCTKERRRLTAPNTRVGSMWAATAAADDDADEADARGAVEVVEVAEFESVVIGG